MKKFFTKDQLDEAVRSAVASALAAKPDPAVDENTKNEPADEVHEIAQTAASAARPQLAPGVTMRVGEDTFTVNDPAPQTSNTRTFYCWFGGSGKINGVEQSLRPSNMQIPCGGERRMDASNRVINAPFKMIEFTDGIFRTEDPDLIGVLEKLMKQSPNITENQDEYLSKILPQEKAVERLQANLEEARKEVNRLKDQLKSGVAVRVDTPSRVVTGPISAGSVPRRGQA